MSKLHDKLDRPSARPVSEPPALCEKETETVLRERLKIFEREKEASRPAAEVKRRLQQRYSH